MTTQQATVDTNWPVNTKRHGWLASEISKEGQSFDLALEQLAALRELVSMHGAAGTHYTAITAEQFRHPALDSFIERMVEELKCGKGIVFLRGIPIDSYSLDELRMIYWGIGTYFG